MSDHEQSAKRLLVHYIELLAKRTGMHWDDDNRTEIEELIEHIIAAARDDA